MRRVDVLVHVYRSRFIGPDSGQRVTHPLTSRREGKEGRRAWVVGTILFSSFSRRNFSYSSLQPLQPLLVNKQRRTTTIITVAYYERFGFVYAVARARRGKSFEREGEGESASQMARRRRRRRRRDRKDENDAWPSVYLTHLFHAALRTAGYVALSIGLDPLAPACHDPLFVKPPFNHPRVPRPQPLARAGVRLTSTSPPHPISFGLRRSFQQPFRSPLGERRSRDSANPALRYR